MYGKKISEKKYHEKKGWKKIAKSLFLHSQRKVFFLGYFFLIFLLTSTFGHPHSPNLSANISIWLPPPMHLFADVILKWSLKKLYRHHNPLHHHSIGTWRYNRHFDKTIVHHYIHGYKTTHPLLKIHEILI